MKVNPYVSCLRSLAGSRFLPAFGLLLSSFGGHAQAPTGRFSRPEVAVGQPLDYELRYEHAPDEEVVFPDSLAQFAPFEYMGRTWQPTRTQHGRSLDRTVYHLRTFALAPTQALQLPVLVLRRSRQQA